MDDRMSGLSLAEVKKLEWSERPVSEFMETTQHFGGGANMKLLSKFPGNDLCADCEAPNPDWASINLGVFLCINCAGVHRQLGVQTSKVRSLNLDTASWDLDTIQFMEQVGNTNAKAMYEDRVPSYYVRPRDCSVKVARNNWIRAKYERKEFLANKYRTQDIARSDDENEYPFYVMPQPAVQGALSRMTRPGKWSQSYAVLHNYIFSIYKKANDSYNESEMNIINAAIDVVEPSKFGGNASYAFLIRAGNIEGVFAVPTKESLFGWVHALRRASVYYNVPENKIKFAQPATLSFLSQDVIGSACYKGYISKQGGRRTSWKKRYFVLLRDGLYYFKNPETGKPDGCINLMNSSAAPADPERCSKANAFMIQNTARTFYLCCDNQPTMEAWIDEINKITDMLTERERIDFGS